MPNEKKVQKVKKLSEKINSSFIKAFFDYKGTPANVLNNLRQKCKESECEILVEKNTLIKIALGEKKPLDSDLSGQTAIMFSPLQDVSPFKVLYEFSKKYESIKLKGAFMGDDYYTAEKVVELAKLPSRLELLSQLLFALKSPIFKFALVAQSIAKEKEKEV